MSTDRIEKKIMLSAPRSRVWKAIADSAQFGAWFGVKLEGAFIAGAPIHGAISTPGKYEGFKFDLIVERIDPETLFSFRWRPYAIDPKIDYSAEPMTLVEFKLSEVDGGTVLELTESGFEGIPAARRAEAFRMNEGGWEQQLKDIERHVAT